MTTYTEIEIRSSLNIMGYSTEEQDHFINLLNEEKEKVTPFELSFLLRYYIGGKYEEINNAGQIAKEKFFKKGFLTRNDVNDFKKTDKLADYIERVLTTPLESE